MTKIEIVKATTIELDPSKKYLMVFDSHVITKEEVENALTAIHEFGFSNLGLVIRGDPTSVMKVIEEKDRCRQ